MTAKTVWEGPKAYRRFLVAVDGLEPFPDNPNRGDVEAVAGSLRRFGQLKPIVVDGSRIVAGHTMTEAAVLLGWTHVAAADGELADDEEARAFLLADNRTAERGSIDEEALAVQLAALRDGYEGTGYDAAFHAELDARLAALRNPVFPPSGEPPPQLDRRAATTGLFEVPLLLGPDDRKDFAQLVKMHQREWGIPDVTAVVLRALRESGSRL